MDTAFALGGACPPAAARVGAVCYPRGAGTAADGRVAVVNQRVHQDVVGGDVLVHLLLCPLDDRVHLDHLAPRVPGDDLSVTAGIGLLPANPGEPGVVGAEGLL